LISLRVARWERKIEVAVNFFFKEKVLSLFLQRQWLPALWSKLSQRGSPALSSRYLTTQEQSAMNTFYEHHNNNIKFGYRCFDRILLNGLIQPFQQPERVVGFFNAYRDAKRLTRKYLADIAEQFGNWVKNRCQKWGAPLLEAPDGRRDDFVDRFFRGTKPDQVVVILKAREPARIMIATGSEQHWFLQLAQRWINQYNFYIHDQRWGRMFVRMCPYLPFSARVCLNQHHWLANRMREKGIDFKQCSNAFLRCSQPQRLQELADSLTAHDLLSCGQKWLTCLTPFFKESERNTAGCQHRLFFSQVEYCDNLIFRRRAALDQLGARLLDLNVQQDILETFVDRHQLKALTAPTILPGGKRIPGLEARSSPATGLDARAGALRQCGGFQQLPHLRSSCSRCRGFGLRPLAVPSFIVALRSFQAQSQRLS
jgi:hypothetical protein